MTFKVKDGISIAGNTFVDGSRNITIGNVNGYTPIQSNNYSSYTMPLSGGATWNMSYFDFNQTTTYFRITSGPGTFDIGDDDIVKLGNSAIVATPSSRVTSGTAYLSTYPYGVSQGDNKTHFGYYNGSTYVNYIRGAATYFDSTTLQVGGNQVLHAGNYNSYSPTLTGGGASGTWNISINGTSPLATAATRIQYDDGPRDLSNRLPNSFTRTVNFDFVGASTGNGSGNYAGVMTYSPWSGTTASTGDSSYQLAFANNSGVNAAGQPKLSIRNGIDSTWNAWYTLLHSGNYNNYSTFSGAVTSGGNNGFRNDVYYSGARNPIWSFGNSTSYGISYFQGTSGINSTDTFGVSVNGSTSATGVNFAVTPANSYVNNNIILHAGNYTNYAVAKNGSSWTPHPSTARDAAWNYFYTDYGYIQFGPANSSWAHIYSNKSFYFNQGIWINDQRVLDAGNYTSYSPSLTGSGASGTWNISINGNSATVGSKSSSAFHQRAHFGTQNSQSSGYYKVRILAATSWMLSFTVRIYQGYESYDIRISGYNYGSNYWYSPQASLMDGSGTTIDVRFGYDSAYNLWVAFPASNYTGLDVLNVVNGYTQFDGNYADQFAIEYQASLTGTVQATVTAYRPLKYNENAVSATTASTLQGYSPNTTGGASTIVQRDGNGYIQNSYFYTSGGGSERNGSGLGYFAAYNSGDYYIRSYTAAAAAAAMGALTTSNYNSYSPTLTGGGASGTWSISISGGSNSIQSSGYGSTNHTWRQESGTFAGYSGWASYLISSHGDGATYYNQTLIMPFWGAPQYSRLEGGVFRGPYTILSTENYTSYTVPVGGGTFTGSITSNGNVTAYSDERKKTNWKSFSNDFVSQLATVKNGTFDRTDITLTQDGVSAQSLQCVMPNSVSTDEKGMLSVNYGGAALASAVELAKEVVSLRDKLSKLEALVQTLINKG